MDDLTGGGPQDIVAKDVHLIMKAGPDVGLNRNISKCELVSIPDCHITEPVLSSLPGVRQKNKLLGVPLLPGAALNSAWSR